MRRKEFSQGQSRLLFAFSTNVSHHCSQVMGIYPLKISSDHRFYENIKQKLRNSYCYQTLLKLVSVVIIPEKWHVLSDNTLKKASLFLVALLILVITLLFMH